MIVDGIMNMESDTPNDEKTIRDNKLHSSACSITTFFVFCLLMAIEGYYAMVDCEKMKVTFKYWINDQDCVDFSARSFYDDPRGIYTRTSDNLNIIELSENGIEQGEGYFISGIIGCIFCLFLIIYWFIQTYTSSTESFIKFNYWFSHIVSFPFLTIVGIFTQLIALYEYSGWGITVIFSAFPEQDFIDSNCDAYNDFDNVITILPINYFFLFGFWSYGIIIPIFISIAFCVRGGTVNKGYEKYQCQICCRCCASCCSCKCTNKCLVAMCCLKDF